MPVLKDISFSLDMDRVMQRQGFKDTSRVRPGMKETIAALVEEAGKQRLIESAVAYETYQVVQIEPERILLPGGVALDGSLLPSRSPNARRLIIVVSTIGPRLETRVKEYTSAGDTLKGMLLDGIGSTAMHSITQEACAHIFKLVVGDTRDIGPTFSPGMAGFPLTEQPRMLTLARAESVGVTLTSSGVMEIYLASHRHN
jgi:hypothetical protein